MAINPINLTLSATHRGRCHCGAVTFEAVALENLQVVNCTCAMCAMTGYMHLQIPKDKFRLLTGDTFLTEYRFGTDPARHLFCRRCGVKSFYVMDPNAMNISVNVRCLEGSTIRSVNVLPAAQMQGAAAPVADATADPGAAGIPPLAGSAFAAGPGPAPSEEPKA
ncbi:MAG TPA: hypothetical protein VGM84_12575 [Steroidobacteraceae bacterium]|jgi:hypothetical protein